MRDLRFAGLVLSALLASACVTEISGGLPKPAAKEQRVKAQLDLARGYLENREWNNARAPLSKALEIDPRSTEAHVLSGVLYEAEDEMALAETSYKKALSIDAAHPRALNNYGAFLYRQRRYDEAAKYLGRLVKDTGYRYRHQAFENLGLTELALGDREAAGKAFNRALMLNTKLVRSNLEMADLAFDRGEVPVAQEYYDAYRSLARQTKARQSARSLCLGMKIYQAVGDEDRVASFGIALKNLYPKSKQARGCLGA